MADLRQIARSRATALEEYYGTMQATMLEMGQAYELKLAYEGRKALAVPVHRPSTAPAFIDQFVAQIPHTEWTVETKPYAAGVRGKQAASKMDSLAYHIMKRLSDDIDWGMAAFDMGCYGAACLKLLFVEDLWPTSPSEQKLAWPFRPRFINPLSVMVSPGIWPHNYVIEKSKRSAADVLADYPNWEPPSRDLSQTIDMLEYWGAEGYYLEAGGKELYNKVSPFNGIVPYVWVFGGLGRTHEEGNPDAQARGILRHIISELKAEMRFVTALDYNAQFYLMPLLVGADSDEAVKQKLSLSAGSYYQVNEPVRENRPEFVAPPVVPSALITVLSDLRRQMERSTYNPALSGARQEGVDYGYLFALQVGQAKQMVDNVSASMSKLATNATRLVLEYIDKVLDSPMDVDGVEVGAKQIKGHYRNVTVGFVDKNPANDERKLAQIMQQRREGIMSLEKALKEKGYSASEVDAEIVAIYGESTIRAAVQAGMMNQVLQGQVAAEAGLAEAQAATAQMQEQLDASVGMSAPAASPMGELPATPPTALIERGAQPSGATSRRSRPRA